jgi:fatty acid desaturase
MRVGRNRVVAAARDDFREAAREDGSRRLPADVLARLTSLDDRLSWRALARTVGLAIAALSVGAWVWTPWVVLPALIVVAAQQHALFVLAHEAAHYRLLANRRLNDLVGRAIGSVTGISMCTYRVVHRLHHNDLYGPDDPDIPLHGGYPRGRGYLVRKLAMDLSGLTAWKTYRYFFGSPARSQGTSAQPRPLDDTSLALRVAAQADRGGVIACQIVMPLVLAVFGGADGLLRYSVLWLLPLATVLQAFLRIRAIAEHGAPLDVSSPLQAARTNLPGPVARFFLFPHHVCHHIEHHLYPAVPQYRLPALHTELAGRGWLAGADIRRFPQTWRRVFAPRTSG